MGEQGSTLNRWITDPHEQKRHCNGLFYSRLKAGQRWVAFLELTKGSGARNIALTLMFVVIRDHHLCMHASSTYAFACEHGGWGTLNIFLNVIIYFILVLLHCLFKLEVIKSLSLQVS